MEGQRSIVATYSVFGVSPEGKPYISVLSQDQKETIEVEIEHADVILLWERASRYIADTLRGRKP
jgi:hypothetical protein